MMTTLRNKIFSVGNGEEFEDAALEAFRYQYAANPVYRQFSDLVRRHGPFPEKIGEIPFLPVEFFRNHRIITGDRAVETVFESSGTTGAIPSRHYITDLSVYEESFLRCFRLFYGEPSGYLIIALLPSYVEREGSSLVYMTRRLAMETGKTASGFYKGKYDQIAGLARGALDEGSAVLLLGVSFALLDLAEKGPADLSGAIVMETGGMKGRRKEMTRPELHGILTKNLNVGAIHSEYGMTELLSQAYSKGEGLFRTPPWMKIIIRDPQDPLTIISEPGRTGGISIIDLANINSCSFLSTGDLGRVHSGGEFEILGRFDSSDIRGCNLMAE